MSEQMFSENGQWDDARIERALTASGDRVSRLSDTRRAEVLKALLAESARLQAAAAKVEPVQQPKPSWWQVLQQLLNPRLIGAMGTLFIVLCAGVIYGVFGGSRPRVAANAMGAFALTEVREGPLGLRWTVPRGVSSGQEAKLSVGDEVIATSPITITFADGSQTIAASGSQLKMISDDIMELVKGEIAANTADPNTEFKVNSLGATFVVTDATFRVKVEDTGVVSQFTDQGIVTAKTDAGAVNVLAGEQATVQGSALPTTGLQAPVIVGARTEDGTLAFTARTLMSSTVVVVDKATGAELAQFKADDQGYVSARLDTQGKDKTALEFHAVAPDGRESGPVVAVSDGKTIATMPSNQTTSLPPPAIPTTVATNSPTLTLPVVGSIPATSRNGAQVTFGVSAADAQDGVVPIKCDRSSDSSFPLGTTTVNCAATNSQGRTATGSFKVTVVDKTAPVLSLPENQTISATNGDGAPVVFNVSASDVVDGAITPVCSIRSGSTFPLGATIVDCTATDSAGNVSKGSFTVTVSDTTGPVLNLPGQLNVSANTIGGAIVNFSASANDAVDGVITVNCTPRSGSTFGVGTTTVNCTASDKSNNSSSGSFSVVVRDLGAPNISVPGAMTVQATSPAGANVNFNVSASDTVEGSVTPTCAPRSGSLFPFGTTTVTCRASDSQGNSTTRSFDVTIVDTTGPVLSLPSNQTVEATGPSGATASFSVSAKDAVDGAITPTCTPRSGSTFGLGTTTVTCRATDTRGNQSSGSFSIVVKDTTAPTLSLPKDVTAEATGPTGATYTFSASANDAVDGTIAPSCSVSSGATFPLGKTTVRCTATDKAGNAASDSFVVTIVDTKPPTLKLPDAMTVKATSSDGALVTFIASATDVVDGAVTPVCTPHSGSTFELGTTTVSCRATDKAGNSASGNFKVSVGDTTAPDLTLPSNLIAEATGPSGAVVNFTVTANDAVDGAVTPTCEPRSGSTFGLGATMVTCRATDKAGNSDSGSFKVTVADTTAPVISVPSSVSAEASSAKGATVNFDVSAADAVNGAVTPNCTPRSGSVFGTGTTTVTCRASDKAGNASSSPFNVIVADTTAPTLKLPPKVTVQTTSSDGATATFSQSAVDTVDGSVGVSCEPPSGSFFSLGTTIVRCTARDRADNTASGSFNVVVQLVASPTPSPTPEPTPTPSATPSPSPTPTPSPSPTPAPTQPPTSMPTPTPTPSPSPTPAPTQPPTSTPTPSPSPTPAPTQPPTSTPTPSPSPTPAPTQPPTSTPTQPPTSTPTLEPTPTATSPPPTSTSTPDPTPTATSPPPTPTASATPLPTSISEPEPTATSPPPPTATTSTLAAGPSASVASSGNERSSATLTATSAL